MQLGRTFYGRKRRLKNEPFGQTGGTVVSKKGGGPNIKKLSTQNQRWMMIRRELCSVLYASCDTVTRRELWQELSNINELCSGPWVSCADYNVTRYPNERSEGHRITGDMQEFTD